MTPYDLLADLDRMGVVLQARDHALRYQPTNPRVVATEESVPNQPLRPKKGER